jgi:uncharacterized SAM-binding protein YcdF (DUF218 family)
MMGRMKAPTTRLLRIVKRGVDLAGLLALLLAAVQFTPLPGRVLQCLSHVPNPFSSPPTHILLMSGSMPGGPGLLRTYHAARIATRNPTAQIVVAPDSGIAASDSSMLIDELMLRGVEAARIHRLPGGANTRQQALQLADYLAGQTHPSPRVLIVTSPAHVRRTAAAIRKTSCAEVAAFPRKLSRTRHAQPLATTSPGSADVSRHSVPLAADRLPELPDDRAVVDDSLLLRYGVWENARLTVEILREGTALLYYRFRGWI